MHWPTKHEHEVEGFHGEFVDELHRDHDIYEYQHSGSDSSDFDSDIEEQEWYLKYEDPHFHAPLSEHHTIHEIESEKRPTSHDFYEFDWHTIHKPALKETHLRPMSEHGAIKKQEEATQKKTAAKKPAEKKQAAPAKT